MPNSSDEQSTRETTPSTPTWMTALKEGTTTVIALAILGMVIWLMVDALRTGITLQDKKDIMLHALPLLGSVMGYYFGRVPAERRAETAEETADKAQHTADNSQRAAEASAQEARRAEAKIPKGQGHAAKAKALIEAGAEMQKAGLSTPGAQNWPQHAMAELDAILEL